MEDFTNNTIVNVFKFKQNNQDAWIYSCVGDEPNLYKYYLLSFENEKPKTQDIINLIATLQNSRIVLSEIEENTQEYMKFLSTLKIANKIQHLEEKEHSLSKKRSE